jgi:hypothetical protein
MSIRTTAALPGTGSLSSADLHLQERTAKAGFEVLGFGSRQRDATTLASVSSPRDLR